MTTFDSNSSETAHPYVYVLIRTDISIEQQLVQVGHAAWEAGQVFARPSRTASLIVLSVPSQAALIAASERLASKGIENKMFFEPDFNMGYSALCTRALTEKAERYLMKKYPLYRAPAATAGLPLEKHAAARLEIPKELCNV